MDEELKLVHNIPLLPRKRCPEGRRHKRKVSSPNGEVVHDQNTVVDTHLVRHLDFGEGGGPPLQVNLWVRQGHRPHLLGVRSFSSVTATFQAGCSSHLSTSRPKAVTELALPLQQLLEEVSPNSKSMHCRGPHAWSLHSRRGPRCTTQLGGGGASFPPALPPFGLPLPPFEPSTFAAAEPLLSAGLPL